MKKDVKEMSERTERKEVNEVIEGYNRSKGRKERRKTEIEKGRNWRKYGSE